MLLALLLVMVGGSMLWVQSHLHHRTALSGAPGTPGTTYLVVGSDSRENWIDDGAEGERTDTIVLIHRPTSGPTALLSIPRDSYVDIPGYGGNKINAAFAFGGPPLLVQTVEAMTGLTIDHYLEVGFGGVAGVVDAVGGVEVCHDADVDDPYSGMVWTAGCHQVNGVEALAFSRMRYQDPLGDIGRTQRQRQLMAAVGDKALSPGTWLWPPRGHAVAQAGLDAFTVSDGTSVFDLVQAAFIFRSALGPDAVTGTPPIASVDYRVEGAGSTVLLDPDAAPEFWRMIATGAFPPGTQVGGVG